jgi:hypothetical protein
VSQAVACKGGKALAPAVRGEIVDGYGLSIHITQVAQALEERLKSARLRRTWIERKKTEPRDLLQLLSVRHKRPHGRTTNQHKELSPVRR